MVYLYESQVWHIMITYGGIILSFIKMAGVEQHPEVCVCTSAACEQVSMYVWIGTCVRLKRISPQQRSI